MGIGRVVLDTNILVSALLSRDGNPAKIYRMFAARAFTLVYSIAILDEYDDVLYRPKLRIPHSDIAIVMDAIRQYGEETWAVQSAHIMPDEDDRVFYDTAKSAGAYLISGNIKHYPNEPFILTPVEFLALLQ